MKVIQTGINYEALQGFIKKDGAEIDASSVGTPTDTFVVVADEDGINWYFTEEKWAQMK